MEIKTGQEKTLLEKGGSKESYEKPEIKALDMSCSQRPDWSCNPCSVFSKNPNER